MEWQVFMDRMICDTKQLMENMVTHRQPVQHSASGSDVITLSLPHHNPRTYILDCLQPLDLC